MKLKLKTDISHINQLCTLIFDFMQNTCMSISKHSNESNKITHNEHIPGAVISKRQAVIKRQQLETITPVGEVTFPHTLVCTI